MKHGRITIVIIYIKWQLLFDDVSVCQAQSSLHSVVPSCCWQHFVDNDTRMELNCDFQIKLPAFLLGLAKVLTLKIKIEIVFLGAAPLITVAPFTFTWELNLVPKPFLPHAPTSLTRNIRIIHFLFIYMYRANYGL